MVAPIFAGLGAQAAPGGGWATPLALDSGSGDATDMGSCSDRSGDAMVVYRDYNGSSYETVARRFVSGAGWQSPVPLSTVFPSLTYYQTVGCSPAGDALASWVQWNGSAYVWVLRKYTADWGWEPQQVVQNMSSYAIYAQVSMDGHGNGYAVGMMYNGTGYELRAALLAADGSPPVAVRLDTTGPGEHKLATSAAEGAVVIWRQPDGTGSNNSLWSARSDGSSWLAPELVEHGDGQVYKAFVALDDLGVAYVSLSQTYGSTYSWYTLQEPGGEWAPVQYLLTSSITLGIAAAPRGGALALFNQWTGSQYSLAFRRIFADGTLGAGATLGSLHSWNGDPSIVFDTGGVAYVSYKSTVSGTYTHRVAQVQGDAWAADARVDLDSSTDDTWYNQALPLGNGHVLAVWRAFTGSSYAAMANIFSGADVSPPFVRVTSPINGYVSDEPWVTVTGFTEPGASVSVGGAAATVGADGSFQATVPLSEGPNSLVASAEDAAGNTAAAPAVHVFYQDPAPLLAAEAAQAPYGGMRDPVQIDGVTESGAWWPLLSTDRDGNAFATWYEAVNGQTRLYLSRYAVDVGWSPAMLVQGEEGGLQAIQETAVDDGGNFSIVWGTNPFNCGCQHVWALNYVKGYGWVGPDRVDGAERYAALPDVATTNNHRFMMVWQERDEVDWDPSLGGFRTHIWARVFDPATRTYSTPELAEAFDRTSIEPRVAVDGQGRSFVTYRTYNGTAYNLGLSMHNGVSWDGGNVIEDTPQVNSRFFVDVDAGGNLTVAWRELDSVYSYHYGRRYSTGTWSGGQLLWNDSWNWDPEVMADDSGRAFYAFTATTSSAQASAYVAVAPPGSGFGTPLLLDFTASDPGGGPKLSHGSGGVMARVHFDELYSGRWHGMMREYNASSDSWGSAFQIAFSGNGAHIPDMAPMPDGGYMIQYMEENATLGMYQSVVRRYVAPSGVPPGLSIYSNPNGTTSPNPWIQIDGYTDGGSAYYGIQELPLNDYGSFSFTAPLVDGSNTIEIWAYDWLTGGVAYVALTIYYNDTNARRIEQLEAENMALQAQLNATNASLQAAIAAGDAALLAQINGLNASLLTQLAAQNSALLGEIASLNATLLAQLAAGDAALAQVIADTNASLLADLAALDGGLTQLIADTNASLLAKMAAQDGALAASIAQTNATLFAALAAQNTALLDQLASQNASLLAAMAAADSGLAQLIADTDATLLASLAAQDADLRAALADQNLALLAELANQNDELLQAIATTNASLLEALASGDSALHDRLTADDAALWDRLNETAAAQQSALRGTQGGLDQTNSSLSGTQDDLQATTESAASAGTMALLGILLGAVGLALGGMAFMMARRRPPMADTAPPPPMPPPTPGGEEEVEAEVVSHAPPTRGSSMAAEGELGGSLENER